MKRNLFNDPLKLGILGCGKFMQNRILPAEKITPFCTITAIQKRDRIEAQKIAHAYQIPYFTDNKIDLIKNGDVEAVYIGSIHSLHEEDALLCAKYNIPVLCEKPLSTTSVSAEKMVKTFQELKIPFLIGQCLRFKPAPMKARELLDKGQIGKLKGIRARYSIPHVGSKKGEILLDLGVHMIDFIRFVTQEEVESVSAMGNFSPDGDTTVISLLRLSSGVIAQIEISKEQPFEHGFEVIGEKGYLVSRQGFRQTESPGETFDLVTEEGRLRLPIEHGNMYAAQLNHAAEVIVNHKPSLINAEEGLINQFVIDAIYRSIEENKTIMVENLSGAIIA